MKSTGDAVEQRAPRARGVWRPSDSPLTHVALGLAGAAAAVALRLPVDLWLGDRQPYVSVFIVVVALALFVGPLAAGVASAAGILGCTALFLAPRGSLNGSEAARVITAGVACAAIVLMAQRYRVLRRDAEEAARRAEREAESARRGEERFRATFEHAPVGIGRTDLDARWEDVNGRLCSLLGMSREELLGRRCLESIHPDEAEEEAERFARMAAGELEGYTAERRFLRADGSVVWVHLTAAVVRGEGGGERPASVIRILRDVTELRSTSDELARSNDRLRVLAQTASDLLMMEDPRQFLDHVYARLAEHLRLEVYFHYRVDSDGETMSLAGYNGVDEGTASGLATLRIGQAVCGRAARQRAPLVVDDVQTNTAEWVSHLREMGITAYACHPLISGGRVIGTLSFGTRNGTRFDADVLGILRAVSAQVAVAVDRAERAEALTDAASRIRAIVETAVDGIITMDRRGRIESVNPAAERTFGYSAEEMVGQDVSMLMPEPYRSGHPGYLERYERTGERRIIGSGREVRGLRKDGTVFPLELSVSEMRVGGRRVYTGMVRDVTERRRAEEALRESEGRLRALTEATFDAVLMHEGGIAIEVNDSLVQMFGYRREELIGRDVARLLVDPESYGLVMRRLSTGSESPYEAVLMRKNGERFIGELRARNIVYKGRHVRVVSARDITDRKNAERELSRHRDHLQELLRERTAELERSHQKLRLTERLAGLGTLAAGLGHDMGNLLLPLRTRLEALESQATTGEMREDIEAIRGAAEYLQRLTHGLRLLALDPDEPAGAARGETDLRAWWPDAEPLMRNALPPGVTLSERLPGPGVRVALARAGLTQAVFNLVQNAGQAIRNRSDGSVEVWAEECADAEGNDAVRIGVTDNGPGMSEEVRRRCLEPFYTTKARTHSTGMGLPLVNAMVQRAGGSLEIRSELGRGSTFVLTLPRADAGDDGEAEERPGAAVSVSDARIRAFVESLLRAFAFDVRPAESPGVCLWVAEGEDVAEDRLCAFLEGGSGQRVVVLGADERKGIERDHRCVRLGRNPKPSELREAIRAAAGTCGAERPRTEV